MVPGAISNGLGLASDGGLRSFDHDSDPLVFPQFLLSAVGRNRVTHSSFVFHNESPLGRHSEILGRSTHHRAVGSLLPVKRESLDAGPLLAGQLRDESERIGNCIESVAYTHEFTRLEYGLLGVRPEKEVAKPFDGTIGFLCSWHEQYRINFDGGIRNVFPAGERCFYPVGRIDSGRSSTACRDSFPVGKYR